MINRVARTLKRKLTLEDRAGDSQRPPADPGAPCCEVCGHARPEFDTFVRRNKPGLVREMAACPNCGFLQIKPLPAEHYRNLTEMSQMSGGGTRIGTESQKGREYWMTRLGLEVLGRPRVDVLIYGVGRSQDNLHVAKLPRVRHVAIGDIMRVREDAEFHDTNLPATRQFDLVIASEVVEHFRAPRHDFQRLFEFVDDNGLLICGTNIYNGKDVTRDPYPFYSDHTSYYTPRALALIARENGYLLDFRVPERAGGHGRKRYVLFTRSAEVRDKIALYFGVHNFAPSDPAS